MELSKEDSFKILELNPDASISDVIRQYKYLALEWFPDKHNRSVVSLKKFQLITQAFLTFYVKDISTSRNLLSPEEMLSLFQFIFFGGESVDDDEEEDDDDSCAYESGVEEDSFEEFYNDWKSDNVELLKEAVKNLSSEKDVPTQKADSEETKSKKKKAKDAVQKAKELIEEEEREKKKAKKRRAQKKRRKEKKKQEKNAQMKTEEVKEDSKEPEESDEEDEEEPVPKHQDSKQQQKKLEKMKEKSSSESEEEIDPESAFVAVIAKKKKKNIPLRKEPEAKTRATTEKPGASASQMQEETSRVLRSRQLALSGNDLANAGFFQEAVQLFSQAIRLDPTDHRFFGNRSYCHERLGNFERALSDAEKSISLAPNVAKGYFRKGKALSGLKRYAESEACFTEVLRLDEQCEDAEKELFVVKVFQILDMGFTREAAEKAIERYRTVSEALDHLLPTATSAMSLRNHDDVFHSDDEDFVIRHRPASAAAAAAAIDPKMDPNNPEGLNSIWVGNLQHGVTKEIVTSLFQSYGKITSVKYDPDKYYAFVNYENKQSAGKAMRALQGAELLGGYLKIRFPETKPSAASAKPSSAAQDTSKIKQFVVPVNGDECYFWRTSGCIHGSTCRYKHVEKNKGIDLRKTRS